MKPLPDGDRKPGLIIYKDGRSRRIVQSARSVSTRHSPSRTHTHWSIIQDLFKTIIITSNDETTMMMSSSMTGPSGGSSLQKSTVGGPLQSPSPQSGADKSAATVSSGYGTYNRRGTGATVDRRGIRRTTDYRGGRDEDHDDNGDDDDDDDRLSELSDSGHFLAKGAFLITPSNELNLEKATAICEKMNYRGPYSVTRTATGILFKFAEQDDYHVTFRKGFHKVTNSRFYKKVGHRLVLSL